MDLIVACTSVIMGVAAGLSGSLPIPSTGHRMVSGQLIGFMPGEQDKGFRDLHAVVIPSVANLVRSVASCLPIAALPGVMMWTG